MIDLRMKAMHRRPAVPAEIQQLIPPYVAGTLSASESEALEEYCILHPEAAAEIESERLLRAGLVASHRAAGLARGAANESPAESAFAVSAPPASSPPVASSVQSRRNRWIRGLALAATLAAVLVGVRIFFDQRHGTNPLLAAASEAAASAGMHPAHLVLLTLRGQRPVLRVGPADKIASVELQPDPATPNAGYDISLDSLGDDSWLPLATLPVKADAPSGNLRFGLSLDNLHDGRLRIGARSADKRLAPVYYEFVLSRATGAVR